MAGFHQSRLPAGPDSQPFRLSGPDACATVEIMNPWVLRTGVAVVANAAALLIAAMILSRFTIEFLPFIVVAVVFTLATMLIKPVAERLAGKYAAGVTWLAGLVTVFLALVIASALAGSAMQIRGFWTWVWATLIVWVGTIAYDLIDDKVIAAVDKRIPGSGSAGSGPTA